jgi:hypothetical protein
MPGRIDNHTSTRTDNAANLRPVETHGKLVSLFRNRWGWRSTTEMRVPQFISSRHEENPGDDGNPVAPVATVYVHSRGGCDLDDIDKWNLEKSHWTVFPIRTLAICCKIHMEPQSADVTELLDRVQTTARADTQVFLTPTRRRKRGS